jgi:FkbM family methyltransferase
MSITINGIDLDADPLALPVYEEVIQRDCYRVGSIPENAEWIIDIGAFHGEFMLWAHKHRPYARLVGYEPYWINFAQARNNLQWETSNGFDLQMRPVMDAECRCDIAFTKVHPAGSMVYKRDDGELKAVSIDSVVAGKRRIALKMDCEGSERAIFSSLDWLERVDWLAMEFHNHDGDEFKLLLMREGFEVLSLEGCQGDPWDKSMAGGILIARRP